MFSPASPPRLPRWGINGSKAEHIEKAIRLHGADNSLGSIGEGERLLTSAAQGQEIDAPVPRFRLPRPIFRQLDEEEGRQHLSLERNGVR